MKKRTRDTVICVRMLIVVVLLNLTQMGCTTQHTIQRDEFSSKERTETTMFLGFIPVFQRETRTSSAPAR